MSIETPAPLRAVDARLGATPGEWRHWERQAPYELLPVVARLDAPISKSSKLEKMDGKTPSRYTARRHVTGFTGLTKYYASPRDIKHWSAEPDYSICLVGRHIGAIDIDIEDAEKAGDIREFIALGCGDLPCRSREGSGSVLLIFGHNEPVVKSVVKTPYGAVEFLGDHQQFVVAGTHKTGARYEWLEGLPTNIPHLSKAEIKVLIEALRRTFGVRGGPSTGKAPIALQLARNAAAMAAPGAHFEDDESGVRA